MFRTRRFLSSAAVFVTAFMSVTIACAHVIVRPQESVTGANEKYTMRVPTEGNSATVRIEVEFPAAAEVSAVDPKTAWNLEQRKDPSGKIVGAIWSGSSIAPREVDEFSFVARNPGEDTKLVWKVIQIYADGTRSEWTGPAGSRTPAPVTVVKKAAPAPSHP